ncbi:MAG: type I-E CRISPR-associated protein Cas5/CasD [Candidatus Accumulibacter sp.]|jgi:CRISPR system Cascade subunit CasD|uniref:type I-E CRISPR-associated protein Cas5/CasD n=1 Tax=Accumulibacter sp. TaxID=2053492 RepID=UPI001AC68631|nr:type I-E CRISPR-associated protein Cas5/CasD [Accumulibacter sp.]MBN8438527.1 type I-E CRISPR-associated protein Cas5/CasD [Accumulibacter sp.]
MDFLVFQLQAPLASWGDTAVGEYRGSYEYPGESALLGLLAAALGVRREDDAALTGLRQGYGFAVGVQDAGALLRDYHTAQVPGRTALKGRPHATRRDELAVPKPDLHTILSTRDYRQNAACLVAVQTRVDPLYTLDALANALRRPRFVLYLGRKSCPPAAPLCPMVIGAVSAWVAFESYIARIEQLRAALPDKRGRLPLEEVAPVTRVAWSDGVAAGLTPDLTTRRKDRVIRRKGWQFGDRTEHVWLRKEGV